AVSAATAAAAVVAAAEAAASDTPLTSSVSAASLLSTAHHFLSRFLKCLVLRPQESPAALYTPDPQQSQQQGQQRPLRNTSAALLPAGTLPSAAAFAECPAEIAAPPTGSTGAAVPYGEDAAAGAASSHWWNATQATARKHRAGALANTTKSANKAAASLTAATEGRGFPGHPITGAEAQGTKRDDTIPAALAEVSPEASSGKHQQYRQHQVLRPLQEGRCDAGAVLKAPTSYCVNRGTMPPTTVGLTPAVTTETPVWSVAPFSARSSLGAVGSEAAAITRGKKAPAFSPVIEAARTALPSPLLSASSVNVMASRSPHEQKQYTHLCQPPQSVRLSPSFRRNRRSPSSRHVRAASSDWSTTNNHGKRVAEPASTLSETPLSLLSPSGRRYCLLRPHQKTLFGPLYEGMLLLGGTSRNSRNSCRFQRVAIKAVDKKLVQLQLDQAQAAAAGTSLSPGTAAAAAAIGSNKELYLLLHLVPETPLAEVFFSTRLQGVPHVHTLTEVFDDENYFYLTSPWAHGEDLLGLLQMVAAPRSSSAARPHSPPPAAAAAAAAAVAAAALSAAGGALAHVMAGALPMNIRCAASAALGPLASGATAAARQIGSNGHAATAMPGPPITQSPSSSNMCHSQGSRGRAGGLSEGVARRLLYQALLGLSSLHRRGIALQDFSLENCLLFVSPPANSRPQHTDASQYEGCLPEDDWEVTVKVCDPGQAVCFRVRPSPHCCCGAAAAAAAAEVLLQCCCPGAQEEPTPYAGSFGKAFRPPESFPLEDTSSTTSDGGEHPYLASRVDSWCFGWSAFYLLTGQALFARAAPVWDLSATGPPAEGAEAAFSSPSLSGATRFLPSFAEAKQLFARSTDSAAASPPWRRCLLLWEGRAAEVWEELGVSDSLSPQFLQLVVQLMQPKGSDRLSLTAALKHPWFASLHEQQQQQHPRHPWSVRLGELPEVLAAIKEKRALDASTATKRLLSQFEEGARADTLQLSEVFVRDAGVEAGADGSNSRAPPVERPIIPERFQGHLRQQLCREGRPSHTLLMQGQYKAQQHTVQQQRLQQAVISMNEADRRPPLQSISALKQHESHQTHHLTPRQPPKLEAQPDPQQQHHDNTPNPNDSKQKQLLHQVQLLHHHQKAEPLAERHQPLQETQQEEPSQTNQHNLEQQYFHQPQKRQSFHREMPKPWQSEAQQHQKQQEPQPLESSNSEKTVPRQSQQQQQQPRTPAAALLKSNTVGEPHLPSGHSALSSLPRMEHMQLLEQRQLLQQQQQHLVRQQNMQRQQKSFYRGPGHEGPERLPSLRMSQQISHQHQLQQKLQQHPVQREHKVGTQQHLRQQLHQHQQQMHELRQLEQQLDTWHPSEGPAGSQQQQQQQQQQQKLQYQKALERLQALVALRDRLQLQLDEETAQCSAQPPKDHQHQPKPQVNLLRVDSQTWIEDREHQQTQHQKVQSGLQLSQHAGQCGGLFLASGSTSDISEVGESAAALSVAAPSHLLRKPRPPSAASSAAAALPPAPKERLRYSGSNKVNVAKGDVRSAAPATEVLEPARLRLPGAATADSSSCRGVAACVGPAAVFPAPSFAKSESGGSQHPGCPSQKALLPGKLSCSSDVSSHSAASPGVPNLPRVPGACLAAVQPSPQEFQIYTPPSVHGRTSESPYPISSGLGSSLSPSSGAVSREGSSELLARHTPTRSLSPQQAPCATGRLSPPHQPQRQQIPGKLESLKQRSPGSRCSKESDSPSVLRYFSGLRTYKPRQQRLTRSGTEPSMISQQTTSTQILSHEGPLASSSVNAQEGSLCTEVERGALHPEKPQKQPLGKLLQQQGMHRRRCPSFELEPLPAPQTNPSELKLPQMQMQQHSLCGAVSLQAKMTEQLRERPPPAVARVPSDHQEPGASWDMQNQQQQKSGIQSGARVALPAATVTNEAPGIGPKARSSPIIPGAAQRLASCPPGDRQLLLLQPTTVLLPHQVPVAVCPLALQLQQQQKSTQHWTQQPSHPSATAALMWTPQLRQQHPMRMCCLSPLPAAAAIPVRQAYAGAQTAFPCLPPKRHPHQYVEKHEQPTKQQKGALAGDAENHLGYSHMLQQQLLLQRHYAELLKQQQELLIQQKH
ncbi:uncharacterized protein LOC34620911, partial [Cyclospora cayetanensis]|uniref:Uncharacterized protein LOC34620911 n=1 Tax=Cyclospora cayetanensis TaxID=88456 RepID=A0A6P6S348_9EIME